MAKANDPFQDHTRPNHGFVDDGHSLAVRALTALLLPQIRQSVEDEHADQLAAANCIERLGIRRRIKREVNRRLDAEIKRQAPPDALY